MKGCTKFVELCNEVVDPKASKVLSKHRLDG